MYNMMANLFYGILKQFRLSKSQMVDGVALAETTPGPVIIVVGFVGFMAGFNHFHAYIAMGSVTLFAAIFYTFFALFLIRICGWAVDRKIARQRSGEPDPETGYRRCGRRDPEPDLVFR